MQSFANAAGRGYHSVGRDDSHPYEPLGGLLEAHPDAAGDAPSLRGGVVDEGNDLEVAEALAPVEEAELHEEGEGLDVGP